MFFEFCRGKEKVASVATYHLLDRATKSHHAQGMTKRTPQREIPRFIQELYPDASDDELGEVCEVLAEYLADTVAVFERLEREKKASNPHPLLTDAAPSDTIRVAEN